MTDEEWFAWRRRFVAALDHVGASYWFITGGEGEEDDPDAFIGIDDSFNLRPFLEQLIEEPSQ